MIKRNYPGVHVINDNVTLKIGHLIYPEKKACKELVQTMRYN